MYGKYIQLIITNAVIFVRNIEEEGCKVSSKFGPVSKMTTVQWSSQVVFSMRMEWSVPEVLVTVSDPCRPSEVTD